jgi:hypothetical protein
MNVADAKCGDMEEIIATLSPKQRDRLLCYTVCSLHHETKLRVSRAVYVRDAIDHRLGIQ